MTNYTHHYAPNYAHSRKMMDSADVLKGAFFLAFAPSHRKMVFLMCEI